MAVLDPQRTDERPATAPSGQRRRAGAGAVVGVVLLAVLAGASILVFVSGDRGNAHSASAAAGLDALPFPDTEDASPESQISFPALLPSQLKTVTVTGSSSGAHSGQTSALPDGRGTAFVPARAFTAGERISVRAALRSAAAGTASGAPNATEIKFTFTVARAPASASAAATTSTPAKSPAKQSFHSSSLHPPVVTVSTPDADPRSGDVFVDVSSGVQVGPMILDSQGRLVWFEPVPKGTSVEDVNAQTYQGEPVLTWWQGRIASGYGSGEDKILNSSYQTVATVHAGEGYGADLHELQVTPQGTALITIYQPVQVNLSSIGGPQRGAVIDSIVQEVDIKTGRLLWEWHALGHVPLSASETGRPTAGTPYDYFHINSIQQLANGNLLISARNTWAVYEISRRTGKVIWTLGGKRSSFKRSPGTQFEWQHDARIQPDGTLTLFDDASSPQEESQSRAIQLTLNSKSMAASLDHSYTHTPSLLAGSQGNFQTLPNGNAFIGWGAEPDISEYSPRGRQIFSARFATPVTSYRAFRHGWTAHPTTRPSIAMSTSPSGGLTVYASWNGATAVARWQLMGGTDPDKLTPLGPITTRSGFETEIRSTTSARYIAVRALDSSGRVLATSAPVSR
jgi:hypothetical protein